MKRKPRLSAKTRRPRRPFVDLEPAALSATAPEGHKLFLGRFDETALRRELDAAGILDGLATRGYPEIALRVSASDGEHRLRILGRRGRISLVELRVAEIASVASEPFMRRRGLDVLSFLVVHWAALQNPRGRFTSAKPRLPGQLYPGLGLGKRLYDRLLAWARDFGKDGLMNLPEYFHNAVLYSSLFRFLSPARQGRFEALRRDLASLHVAAASAAVKEGRVFEQSSGTAFRWEPGEMVAPINERLRAYLDSEEYARATAAASAALRFRLRNK
jgi:GNAT superfamily N-acetyltransferase